MTYEPTLRQHGGKIARAFLGLLGAIARALTGRGRWR
jgi:hypothetical protein